MTILFDSARPANTDRPFAVGIGIAPLAGQDDDEPETDTTPPFTPADSDLRWAAEYYDTDFDFDAEPDDFEEPDFDSMAADALAQHALDSGFIPRDLADLISRTSLVGHPA